MSTLKHKDWRAFSDFLGPRGALMLEFCEEGLLKTVASGRSSCRGADTYPAYGEHRRREIRPRSRFAGAPEL